MMDNWGVTPVYLHAKAWEYADILAKRGKGPVVDLAFAGGLAREDHIFKALALGAPYARMVCMGRAMMIPAFLGSNIEGALNPERRGQLSAHWDSLPAAVSENGARPEEIFACYEADTGADLALIASLVLGDPAAELLWRVRDAAYYLRWRELTDDQDGGA